MPVIHSPATLSSVYRACSCLIHSKYKTGLLPSYFQSLSWPSGLTPIYPEFFVAFFFFLKSAKLYLLPSQVFQISGLFYQACLVFLIKELVLPISIVQKNCPVHFSTNSHGILWGKMCFRNYFKGKENFRKKNLMVVVLTLI